jgi:hypothetical protein
MSFGLFDDSNICFLLFFGGMQLALYVSGSVCKRLRQGETTLAVMCFYGVLDQLIYIVVSPGLPCIVFFLRLELRVPKVKRTRRVLQEKWVPEVRTPQEVMIGCPLNLSTSRPSVLKASRVGPCPLSPAKRR